MRIPLVIGAVLVVLTFAGWVVGDVDFVIYAILAAPLAGFGFAWLSARRSPREARVPDEMQAFYSTVAVTAICIFFWALALNGLG